MMDIGFGKDDFYKTQKSFEWWNLQKSIRLTYFLLGGLQTFVKYLHIIV
jgi:hypothetical protein